MRTFKISLLCCVIFISSIASAQLKFLAPNSPRDTNYVISYYDSIALRTYVGQKYIFVQAGNPFKKDGKSFTYLPNSGLTVGVGGIYKIYSLNLGVGIPMSNGREAERGKSKYLDLQSTVWGRRWMYDAYGQFSRGFYLSTGDKHPKDFIYDQRPDIRVRVLGGTVSYIFNSREFSFRGSLVQDEIPRHSKGTFVASVTATRNQIESINAIPLVPIEYEKYYGSDSIINHTSLQAGLGIGYAYQYSFTKQLFTLLSVSGRAVVDYTIDESKTSNINTYSIQPNATFVAGIGYLGHKTGVTVSLVHTYIKSSSYGRNPDYSYNFGAAKLTFIYRINSTPFTRRLLKPLDNLLLE